VYNHENPNSEMMDLIVHEMRELSRQAQFKLQADLSEDPIGPALAAPLPGCRSSATQPEKMRCVSKGMAWRAGMRS
jgi:hypothetical protein